METLIQNLLNSADVFHQSHALAAGDQRWGGQNASTIISVSLLR